MVNLQFIGSLALSISKDTLNFKEDVDENKIF